MRKTEAAVRDQKRARFARGQKRRLPTWVVVGLGLVGLLAIFLAAGLRRPASKLQAGNAPKGSASPERPVAATSGHDPYPEVVAEGGTVRLPLSDFADGKARFYTYMNGGRPIEFFVLRSSDGVVRAAFNACDVCFEARRGYRQEGAVMVCNNCGRRFPSNQINLVQGGCNPAPLRRTIEGEWLVIDVEDLIAGQRFF